MMFKEIKYALYCPSLDKFWKGNISTKSNSTISTVKFSGRMKDEWEPIFLDEIKYFNKTTVMSKLIAYNKEQYCYNNKLPDIVLQQYEYMPVLTGDSSDKNISSIEHIVTTEELYYRYGKTLATAYYRAAKNNEEYVYAITRRGETINNMRSLGLVSVGNYTFLRSDNELMKARLKIGSNIVKLYDLRK